MSSYRSAEVKHPEADTATTSDGGLTEASRVGPLEARLRRKSDGGEHGTLYDPSGSVGGWPPYTEEIGRAAPIPQDAKKGTGTCSKPSVRRGIKAEKMELQAVQQLESALL